MGQKTMFLVASISIFVLMVCAAVGLLVSFRPYGKKYPEKPFWPNASGKKLLSTIVLYRRGAELPANIGKETGTALFPSKTGEIVDILKHLQTCKVYADRISSKCGKTPTTYTDLPAYEGFIYECIDLNRDNKLFANAKDFSKVEGLIKKDQKNEKTPSWFKENKEKIYSLYEKTINFIVGTNEHHEAKILRAKQGFLLSKIIKTLQAQGNEYEDNNRIEGNLTFYPTHEWIMMAFLHSLGVGKLALGTSVPGPNPLIFIELYRLEHKPMVRVLYKDSSMIAAKDLTASIRGCSFNPCHVVEFSLCCKEYESDNLEEACDPKVK